MTNSTLIVTHNYGSYDTHYTYYLFFFRILANYTVIANAIIVRE